MAATTISDLPRDMLVLIFRAAFDPADREARETFGRWDAHEIHKNLRRVSREWRDVADVAYIEHQGNYAMLWLPEVRDPATVRARFPSLIHQLSVRCSPPDCSKDCRLSTLSLALASLCTSPDLRRVLTSVRIETMCCRNVVAAAVSTIAACPHLTSLDLGWQFRGHFGSAQPNMLAPLSQLTGLQWLTMQTDELLPMLPDSPSLTSLSLERSSKKFAPVASDASLGRLRCLSLKNWIKIGHDGWWESDDPFGLRGDLDAGAWRPHLLTSLQKLDVWMECHVNGQHHEWEPDVFDGDAPAAAVWAPLVPTVTKLELFCDRAIYYDSDVETGMYAGLGVLTGLRALQVDSIFAMRRVVDFERVHLPHLTRLTFYSYWGPPIDLTSFPELVHVDVGADALDTAAPIVLSSVAALRGLESLSLSGSFFAEHYDPKPLLDLAQLFGGGSLAALTKLSFERVTLVWAAAPGAPTAAEFAARARTLLPSLRSVEVKEDVDMDEEVREFVLPALLTLGGG